MGSFLFRELRQRPTVLYLILPGRRLKTCSRWFRLIVGSALNELMDEQKTRGLPCLFVLDEFAQLGPMKAIEDLITMQDKRVTLSNFPGCPNSYFVFGEPRSRCNSATRARSFLDLKHAIRPSRVISSSP